MIKKSSSYRKDVVEFRSVEPKEHEVWEASIVEAENALKNGAHKVTLSRGHTYTSLDKEGGDHVGWIIEAEYAG